MAADAKRYVRLSPKGVVQVIKTAEGFALRFNRYEPETGALLEVPELQEFKLDEIEKRIGECEYELGGLHAILGACAAL